MYRRIRSEIAEVGDKITKIKQPSTNPVTGLVSVLLASLKAFVVNTLNQNITKSVCSKIRETSTASLVSEFFSASALTLSNFHTKLKL